MSESQSESYLLEKLWMTLLNGKVSLPRDAGQESSNYYLDKIIETLEAYGGLRGIASGSPLPNPIPSQIAIGNGDDYTNFDPDGTMQAIGAATCYRDELQSLISARLTSPAGDFVLNEAENSITSKNTARYPTDSLSTNHQLNHDWRSGTTIYPHLHWWQTTSAMPNWLIGYRWQKQGSAKTTAWTLQQWTSNAFTYSAGTLNQITAFLGITAPAGYGEVSDIVQFKIYRDVTNVSTLFSGSEVGLGDMDMVNFDAHIEIDMLGSRGPYQK